MVDPCGQSIFDNGALVGYCRVPYGVEHDHDHALDNGLYGPPEQLDAPWWVWRFENGYARMAAEMRGEKPHKEDT